MCVSFFLHKTGARVKGKATWESFIKAQLKVSRKLKDYKKEKMPIRCFKTILTANMLFLNLA